LPAPRVVESSTSELDAIGSAASITVPAATGAPISTEPSALAVTRNWLAFLLLVTVNWMSALPPLSTSLPAFLLNVPPMTLSVALLAKADVPPTTRVEASRAKAILFMVVRSCSFGGAPPAPRLGCCRV